MKSREELRTRRRRIIWNNDGDDLNVTANWNAPGAEWRRGVTGYEHFPRRFECVDDYLGVRMKGKLEGTQVDFARANGMEFFYSYRMNDIHLSAHRASWLWSKFRLANLHLLQGRVDHEWFKRKFDFPDNPAWLRFQAILSLLYRASPLGLPRFGFFPDGMGGGRVTGRAWLGLSFEGCYSQGLFVPGVPGRRLGEHNQ